MTDPPQDIIDVRATEDLGEIPDPEAEAYANVRASTSLPDLAVGAAANVGATSSLVIGQITTHTNLRSAVDTDIGRAIGGDSAPAASEVLQSPSLTCVHFQLRNIWRVAVAGILHLYSTNTS